MRTEPKNHSFIFAFMFGAMVILGGFQQEQFFYVFVIGCLGLGFILGTVIQGNYPNMFRQLYGGGKIEE